MVQIAVEDYNDNPPVFLPVSYSVAVREDEPPGVSLIRVSASDSDAGSNKEFRFSIASGDPAGQFCIEPPTGELFVHESLDRETQDMFRLTVRATNTGTSIMLAVQIRKMLQESYDYSTQKRVLYGAAVLDDITWPP